MSIVGVIALLIGVALGWWIFGSAKDAGTQVPDVTSGMRSEEFQQRVKTYLTDHPEVIVEAIQRYKSRRLATKQAKRKDIIASRKDELLHDPTSPVGGNPQGDITLVEFSDYNCPYCRRFTPVLAKAEAADPMLRVVHKEIPILGPSSLYAATAALAARRQGKYIAFHRALMEAKGVATKGLVLAIAAKVGIDVTQLKHDSKDPAIQAAIGRNLALARALQITGTPTFVIDDRIVSGAMNLERLQALVRHARATK